MIPIGSIKMEGAIGNHRAEIEKILKDAKSELVNVKKNFDEHFNQLEKDYLDKVIACFEEDGFLTYNQFKIRQKAETMPDLPERTVFKDSKGVATTSLTNHILAALNYKALRKGFYPKFFRDLGLKACVYCNSQPALAIKKYSPKERNVSIRGKFQLDHYLGKDEYPFLSICVYNLYPVCGCCNNAKSVSAVDFDLYGDQPAKPYRFELSSGSLAKYLLSGDPGDIRISFIDPEKGKQLPSRIKSFQEVFNIQGIYETQSDLAEELILKSQIYTEAFKQALIKSSNGLLSDEKLASRFLIGNYTDIDDTHRRPMAKFVQDIAKQLNLL